MFSWMKLRTDVKSAARRDPKRNNTHRRLSVEHLEARELMTVNYYGGKLLPHVEVQGLYLGQDWYYNSANYQTTGKLEGFLNYIVKSPYMDMLTKAGYGVGQGTFDQGRIDTLNINKGYYLTDTMIRQQIQAFVNNGNLKTPDTNRLYVVYVEPGVAIMNDHDQNSTSIKDFLGYHGAFAGRDRFGYAADIHYAVIAYPGGYNYTSARNGLPSDFAQLTEVTSHELAEAVTDPNVNYKTLGWYDPAPNRGEIGDIVNLQTFTMNGYVVQKESDRYDRAITPSSYGLSYSTVASASASSNLSSASSTLWNQATASLFSSSKLTSPLSTVTLAAGDGSDSAIHHLTAKSAGRGTAANLLHRLHLGALDKLFAEVDGIA